MKRKRLDESLTKTFWYKLTGQYDKLPKIDLSNFLVDDNGIIQPKKEDYSVLEKCEIKYVKDNIDTIENKIEKLENSILINRKQIEKLKKEIKEEEKYLKSLK